MRWLVSEIAFLWWKLRNPVKAIKWWRDQRRRNREVLARWEAFKASRGK